ncbi:MAG: DUF952 domain-containing protein [Anaerolineales bacterium]
MHLHVTSREAWSAAQGGGKYSADSLAGDGFIHCSKVDQIVRVANDFYSGQHGLVLLVIDPGCLTSELRWDAGTDLATELFPHIYGPINLEAVVEVVDFEPAADGKFHLPRSLEFAGR